MSSETTPPDRVQQWMQKLPTTNVRCMHDDGRPASGTFARVEAVEALFREIAEEQARIIPDFVARVNARAEADILAGRPITGAHHRALTAELEAR